MHHRTSNQTFSNVTCAARPANWLHAEHEFTAPTTAHVATSPRRKKRGARRVTNITHSSILKPSGRPAWALQAMSTTLPNITVFNVLMAWSKRGERDLPQVTTNYYNKLGPSTIANNDVFESSQNGSLQNGDCRNYSMASMLPHYN